MEQATTLGIVIPTYQEKDNITVLLDRVKTVVDKNKITTEVLVMDDSSPDGTADLVKEYAKKNKSKYLKVSVHVRPGKMGLGSAYKTGLAQLKPNVKYLLEMDADLSHQPEYIPAFIDAMKAGADFVIGSRYIEGGGVENWGWHRKAISQGAALYCWAILGVRINDYTGGYNMYKSNIFDTVKLTEVKAEGYLFQIEMKYKAAKAGFKFTEVPIIFPDRSKGKSKFDKKIMLEALKGVWKLR